MSDFDAQPSSSLRQDWRLPSNKSVALFLGRLHPKKGIEFLLRALKQMPDLGIHLIIAGDGEVEYVSYLKALSVNDPRVQFVGMLDGEVRRAALATADFFVLTSYQENFGNAVVEALASNTPVIITPGVNLANVISQHQVGEVVSLDDASIQGVLRRWTQNPQLVADCSVRCRTAAGELFDWAEIGKRWVEHYRRLIGT
ncbi:glycosyltransferase [Rhodopirellula bahusiensis]|uniref:glycosyltransferase n=1 Tax=Rhodopirellula bahusiensis TaxID=2014065 RepID=UPI003263BDE0